jgi:hypothetical protein
LACCSGVWFFWGYTKSPTLAAGEPDETAGGCVGVAVGF